MAHTASGLAEDLPRVFCCGLIQQVITVGNCSFECLIFTTREAFVAEIPLMNCVADSLANQKAVRDFKDIFGVIHVGFLHIYDMN